MYKFFIDFDTAISSFIVSVIPHNLFFDYIFAFFSLKGSALAIWLIPLAILFFVEQKQDKRFILFFSFNFALTLLTVNYLLKEVFHRIRPFVIHTSQIYACPTDFSFPSGHASTAFAAATTLAFFDKKRRYLYFLIAVLISLSRIYFQCHYFLDVMIGAFAGITISRLVLLFYKPFVVKKQRPE